MHHGAALRKLTRDEELVRQLREDHQRAELDPPDRQMLEYVEKLTRTPWEIGPEDIDKLRGAGFSDTAILDINQVASYFNFVNRLASGLGVELEPEWPSEELR